MKVKQPGEPSGNRHMENRSRKWRVVKAGRKEYEILTSNISSPMRRPPFLWAAPFGLRPQINTAIRFLSLCPAREIPNPRLSFSRVIMSTLCPRFWYFFCTFSARFKKKKKHFHATCTTIDERDVSTNVNPSDARFVGFRVLAIKMIPFTDV